MNDKKSFFGKIKASFSGRKFRGRMYITTVTAVVFVIILVVNMLASQLNIQIDVSSRKLYTLTEDTKKLVSELNEDVTIYYLAQTGSEEEIFKKIVEKYDGLSDRISLVYKDPVLYPTFAKEYVEENVSANSLIVVNNATGRAKYIDFSDMLVQELDYNTYSYNTTGIDVEGELTSAIQFVTSGELPVMYVVEGHGETENGAKFKEALEKMNIDIQALKTLSATSIPEDCGLLYINSPTTDFNEEETTMIREYLASGGSLLATVNYRTAGLKNYLSILDYYGVELVNDIVFEADMSMLYSNNPMYLLPAFQSHSITSLAQSGKIPVIMPQSVAVKQSGTTRSSMTFNELLTTSASSYAKNPENITTAEKEKGDLEGPFTVGLLAADSYQGTETKVVVYTTDFAFADAAMGYGNHDLLRGTMGYLIGESASPLSIPTKSMEAEYIYTSQAQALAWGAVIIVLVPLAILITGIVISVRRRRK